MKGTGIIRRIDDLGRVVIPREIRRTLHIIEGDPLELFVEDGAVIFKRYRPSVELARAVKEIRNSVDEAALDYPTERRAEWQTAAQLLEQACAVLQKLEKEN